MEKYTSKILNNVIKKIEIIKSRKEIFKNIQIGEMVWAKMPLKNKEIKRIEESHRIRPYLVVKKEKNFFLGYQSSSKKREKYNNYQEYCLKKLKYKSKKDSWIDLTNIKKIPLNNIISKYIKLSEIDLKRIEKRIHIEENRENHKVLKFNKAIYIEAGDVIVYNEKLYYAYTDDNVNIYCFEIHKKRKDNQEYMKIIINRKTYYADFKALKVINRKNNLEINNIAYDNEVLEILNQKHELKSKTNKKSVA